MSKTRKLDGLEKATALKSLARRIVQREQVIEAKRRQTMTAACETMAEIILQGADLIEAKSHQRHSQWLFWLTKHFPKSAATAQRYMRIAANASRVTHLENGSLRQALAILHCFPDESAAAAGPAPALAPVYDRLVFRLSKITALVQKNPIDDWPDQTRGQLKEQLEPIVRGLWPERFNEVRL